TKIEKDRKDAQDGIDEAGGKIRDLERQQNIVQSIMGLDASAKNEIADEPAVREKIRKQLEEYANAECPFGGVLFSECSYVLDRKASLKITEIQDAHAAEQNEAKRAASSEKLGRQKSNIARSISSLKTCMEKTQRT